MQKTAYYILKEIGYFNGQSRSSDYVNEIYLDLILLLVLSALICYY